MWASLSLKQRAEWRVFYDVEPDGDERNDYGLAHVVQVLVRAGKPLSEYLLPFGDTPRPAPLVQSVAYQEMLLDAWIMGSNAVMKRV